MDELKSVFINPLTDFGFKRIFGQEEDKKYLISFLNALLKEDIVDVVYGDKEGVAENKEGRGLIYDIYCRTADGRRFIVEMQNKYQDFFDDRALYYVASEFTRQARKGGEWRYQFLPVVGVFMMNFDWHDYLDKGPMSGKNEHLCERIILWNVTAGEQFSDKINMFFIKLPLMEKTPEECENDFDIWIYLLKNLEKMDAMPAAFRSNKIFTDLEERARVAALSTDELSDYEKSLKVYRDNYAIAQTERRLGREEGILEVAFNLKQQGFPFSLISSVTGISTQEFENL